MQAVMQADAKGVSFVAQCYFATFGSRGSRMKKCPVCEVPMSEVSMSHETVDRCPRCRGVFFDCGELEALVDLVRRFNEVDLAGEEDIDTIPQAERDRVLSCPVDGGRMLEKDVGEGFIIDLCQDCGGIWLDDGELNAIKVLEDHIRENITLYIRLGQ